MSSHQHGRHTSRSARSDAAWALRLYVAGRSSRSIAAIANARHICTEYLGGAYRMDVIDLASHPELAANDDIVAIPTLVRWNPSPLCKIVGDLSNMAHVLKALELGCAARGEGRAASGPGGGGGRID